MSDFSDLPADRRRRERMVRDQLADCDDPRVVAAMAALPRHWFVPEAMAMRAYEDGALAIGHDQTISQPRVVAYMLARLGLEPGQRVLDVGAGSGYVTALLARLVAPDGLVCAIERQSALVPRARRALAACDDLAAVELDVGDGYAGRPERAPFDRIHVACAAAELPRTLTDQLAPGGRLIIPTGGDGGQQLRLITKDADGALAEERLWPVIFVPMLEGVEGS